MRGEMTPEEAQEKASKLILDLLQRLSGLTVDLLSAARNPSKAALDERERLRQHLETARDKAIATRNHADWAVAEIARIERLFGWEGAK